MPRVKPASRDRIILIPCPRCRAGSNEFCFRQTDSKKEPMSNFVHSVRVRAYHKATRDEKQ